MSSQMLSRSGKRPRRFRQPALRPVYFYIPANLNLVELSPALAEQADCAHYLLHCVIIRTAFWQADAAGYVRLKVAYLRKVIPDRHERQLRRALVNVGVLECDHGYQAGVRSRGYRLAARYAGGFRRVGCQDTRVARRVRALRPSPNRPRSEVHRYLYQWYRRLEIDRAQAEQIALGLEHPQIHAVAIDMIDNGDVEFSSCKQGRVHTNLTRLSRELRPALRVNGQPLKNVDLVNSQPLMLALLIHAYRGEVPRMVSELSNQATGSSFNQCITPRPPTIHTNTMSNNLSGRSEAQPPSGFEQLTGDLSEYIELCEQGMIYEKLQSLGKLDELSRSDLKKKVFTEVFYGRNEAATDFTRHFRVAFPRTAALIRELKVGDHGNLARLMQKVESSFMIGRVCRRLMMDHPEIPIFTIHDSVMTTRAGVPTVVRVIENEFARLGLRPKVKIDG